MFHSVPSKELGTGSGYQRVLRPRWARPDHQGSGTSPYAEMGDLVLPTLAASADAERDGVASGAGTRHTSRGCDLALVSQFIPALRL